MSVVVKRRKLTVLELLNGGSFEGCLPKVRPQLFPPEPVLLPITRKVLQTKEGRKEKESADDFFDKVASAQPLPNMRRCFYSENRLVHSI
jgi:hypothetical protein